MKIQEEILQVVQKINPFDETERNHISNTVEWIKSGAELFRIQKPDIPPKHLVSYFVLIDPEIKQIMLVDHIKAGLWLPAGGHVEKDEHPNTTVEREIQEELNMSAYFLQTNPLFITQTVTVGKTAGHTDVSLWYTIKADSKKEIKYDPNEFNGYKWFSYDEALEMSIEKLDPHFHRFLKKWMINSN